MYRVKTVYKWLAGYLVLLEIAQSQCFARPLKILPPYDPKGDVEFINPEEIPEGSSSELFPSIHSIRVETTIRFRYARTKVISRIVNEDQKKSYPVNFTLTIPSNAFITNFEMKVHEIIYKSNITSNQRAKEIYEFAAKEGRSVTAGILEQGKNANSFNLNFVIGAKKTVRFRVTYEELLIRNDDRYEYSFNFKSTQMYMSVLNYHIKVTIDESQPINVHVPQMPEEFSSGAMERQPKIKNNSPTKAEVIWDWSNSPSDHLTIIGKPFEDIFIVQYALENETAFGEILIRNGHFVHFFAPVGMIPLSKHVVFVLDTSDSMAGQKLIQLQSAMKEILDILKPEDFFNMISFSGDTQLWSHYHGNKSRTLYPFPATAEYKDSAQYFIENKLVPHGSTNIFAALEKAIEVCHNFSSKSVPNDRNNIDYFKKPENELDETLPEGVESLIVFLTDGEPTSGIVNQRQLLQTIKELNTNPFVPIYSLAFGETADYEFLKELSFQNGGFSRKIYEDAGPDIQVAHFYKEISLPVMSNVTFKYTSKNPRVPFQLDVAQEKHLIFQGQEVIYAGQLPANRNFTWDNTQFNAVVEGKSNMGYVVYNSSVKSICVNGSGFGACNDDEESTDDFLKRLFVYLDIRKFVVKDMNTNPYEYENLNSSYCEKILDNEEQFQHSVELYREPCNYLVRKQKIIDAAIKFKFVTPFTSLIMRTKSIAEEENDNTGQSQNLLNWEWFLGSEIPAPRLMKVSAVDTDAYQQEIIAIPKPQSLVIDKQYTRESDSIPSSANINETLKAPSNESSVNNIRETMTQLVLALSKIHLLVLNNHSTSLDANLNDSLTLNDVKWLGTSEIMNIPTVNEYNKTVPTYYRILRSSEFNSTLASSFQLCRDKSSELVECRHLKDCIRHEFINDFELYKSSYICPVEVGDERYLGSCCPLI